MACEWFERHWCWIGLLAAIVLLIALFCTNVFRNCRDVSRWRDPVWLAWLITVAYVLHNFEEYGIDQRPRLPFPGDRMPDVRLPQRRRLPVCAFILCGRQRAVRVGRPPDRRVVVPAQPRGRTDRGRPVADQRNESYPRRAHPTGLFARNRHGRADLHPAVGVGVCDLLRPGKLLARPFIAVILLASILAQVVLLALLLSLAKNALSLRSSIAIQIVAPVLLFILPWAASRRWPPLKPAVFAAASD